MDKISKETIALRRGFREPVDSSQYHRHMSSDSVDFFHSLDDRSSQLRDEVASNLRNLRGERLATLHMDVKVFGSMISKSLQRVYGGEG